MEPRGRKRGVNRAWENSSDCGSLTRADVKVRETPKHVAEIGGWSLRQVQKMCATGELPAHKIGGTWSISGAKLCEILGIED